MAKKRRYKKHQTPPIQLEKKTIKTIFGISAIAGSILIILSFFTQQGILQSINTSVFQIFGAGSIVIPLLIIILSLPLLGIKNKFTKPNVVIGIFAALLCFIALITPLSVDFAGSIGVSLWDSIVSLVTPIGAFFILFFALVASIVIASNTPIDQVLSAISGAMQKITHFFSAIYHKFFNSQKPGFVTKSSNVNVQGRQMNFPAKNLDSSPAVTKEVLADTVVLNTPGQGKIWEYPPLSLLSGAQGGTANRGNLKQNAQIIEKTLESFGVSVKVVEVNLGPTITQYALEIPMGTKLSKIMNLQNDLALALATSTGNVRIEAPIPGKSLVGIEIPNISPEIVSLKNLLSSDMVRTNKSKTVIGLGLDVSGNPVISDIAKMPHVLIAGTTGSGKSVLLNALIATLLFRASPQEVKLILIDPKRVELTGYNDIPHLLTPVIDEPEKSLSAVKWATHEMERRYKLFREAQVKNIAGYNELSGFQALPYIIIVIDELHNLMEFAPAEVENAIIRLASMARATGIHLVVATQRPSVDVITGTIKANIPCRIAFNVSSMVDSRVVLDTPGAEKLLGKGDMLYIPPEASKPVRIQGVYVSDTEIRNLINFLKRSGVAPEYTEEVLKMPVGKQVQSSGAGGDKDDLFEEAVRTICQYDRASASLLQRRLKVGYARAARLLDELEMAGIVGPGEGSKPREVLVQNAEEFLQSQHQPGEEA